MAEYIEKWSVVNRLIDLENEFQQYKPFHSFEHAMYRKVCEAEISIGKTQAADVVPKSLYDQTAWERDLAIKQLREDYGVELGVKKKDVAPARHGRWVNANSRAKTSQRRCTACSGIAYFCGIGCSYKFCPNCGARMEGGDKNDE